MHPVLFHVFGFPLGTYALMASLALAAGVAIFSWLAQREGQDRMAFVEAGLWAFIIALFSSKIFGAIVSFDPKDPNKWQTLYRVLRFGGHYYIGFIAGSLFLVWFFARRRVPLLKGLDWLAPGLSLAHGIGRIGCFFAGCCWGKACSLPWAVTFTSAEAHELTGVPLGVALHPTQLYEMAAELLIAPILLWKILKHPWRAGSTFLTYVAIYGVVRFLVEFVRDDPRGRWTWLGGWPTSQPIALATTIAALAGLAWLARRPADVSVVAPVGSLDASAIDDAPSKKKRRKR
jgi:phosphatidylglycerol:prolipoprotein diacylglycerol transferase